MLLYQNYGFTYPSYGIIQESVIWVIQSVRFIQTGSKKCSNFADVNHQIEKYGFQNARPYGVEGLSRLLRNRE